MDILAAKLLYFFVLAVSLTIHEASHAWAALRLGDDTAARMGRLSLNPLAHLDPLGTLMILSNMPLGWAKPVPVNPLNLRNVRTAMPLVSFAGPLSNLVLGLAGCMVYFVVRYHLGDSSWFDMLFYFIRINFSLAVFNLLPIYPLDGSSIVTVFMSDKVARRYEETVAQMHIFPLILLLAFQYMSPASGPLTLWYRIWNPLLNPILALFSVPPSFLWN